MNDATTALARRLMTCPGWRWMPRMFDSYGDTVIEVRGGAVFVASRHDGLLYQRLNALPDLDDPATLGCLLALVREAGRDPLACVVPYRHDNGSRITWFVGDYAGATWYGRAHTEAEALVAALEAAPR